MRFGRAAGAEALQLSEGAVVGALGGIDAALEAGEAIIDTAIDVADGRVLIQFGEDGFASAFDFVGPQLGFEAGKALEEPIGADERIDEETFEEGGGGPIVVIAGGDGFEFRRIFAGDDLGLRVNPGFERIEARGGLALGSTGAGGELRIATIRFDLRFSGH